MVKASASVASAVLNRRVQTNAFGNPCHNLRATLRCAQRPQQTALFHSKKAEVIRQRHTGSQCKRTLVNRKERPNVNTSLHDFNRFAAANKAIINADLNREFSLDSLLKSGERHGQRVGASEVASAMGKLVANSEINVSYRDSDGDVRELTLDEASLASGGAAYVLTVAAVGVVVGVAVAVSVYAGAYTYAAVYAQVYLWG